PKKTSAARTWARGRTRRMLPFAGADCRDIGRVGAAVRADDVLPPVARLDVIVQDLAGELAARNDRREPPLLRAVHRADVVEDAARPVVERDDLGVDAGARDAVDVEVGARGDLVGDRAGDRLGDVRGQVGAFGQLLARGLLFALLVLPLGLARVGLAAGGDQLLLGVAFALGLVAGGGELLVGLGLLAGELLEVALLVGELPVAVGLVVRQLLFGVAFALGLVAGGGELLVGLGLLAGELLEVALLVGELPVGLRFVVRQLLFGVAFALGLVAGGGELPVVVGLLAGELLEVALLVGELPVGLRFVVRQLVARL